MRRAMSDPKRLCLVLLVLVGTLVLCSACNTGLLFLALFK